MDSQNRSNLPPQNSLRASGGDAPQLGSALEAIQTDMSQLRANLSASKEARKRSELDAQLLANRIALLRQEEAKAWKKIEETRRRAKQVSELKDHNEQKYVAKEEFYKKKYENLRNNQAQNAYDRDRARAQRSEKQQKLVQSKMSLARQSKAEQNHYMMAAKEKEEMERTANMARSLMIKKQREEAKRRVEQEKVRKLEQFRQEYESRVAQEELLRGRTEGLVAQMEKEEMELIQRLQNTQSIQRAAFEELESALGGQGGGQLSAQGTARSLGSLGGQRVRQGK